MLGIPFYVWDLSDRFAADVVSEFVAEYAAGRTPNPCLRCNEKIKFSAVLDRGVALGFDAVCTGHYARLIRTGDDVELYRAVDAPARTSRTSWPCSTNINFAALLSARCLAEGRRTRGGAGSRPGSRGQA